MILIDEVQLRNMRHDLKRLWLGSRAPLIRFRIFHKPLSTIGDTINKKLVIKNTFTPRFVFIDRFRLWERSKIPESLVLVGSTSRKERVQKLIVLALIANRNSYEVCETFLPPRFDNCA